MTFTDIWDSTFESLPNNNTYGYLIDDYFRRLYIAIRERMQVDHVWESAQLDGAHNKVSLALQTIKPAVVAGYGYLYTKDVGSGAIELFYEDAAANEVQLSKAGSLIKNPSVLPYAASAVGTDAYAITTGLSISALSVGMTFTFKADVFNTGGCTLKVDSCGATAIVKLAQKGTVVDPATGDIHTGQMITVVFDGSYFQLLNNPGEAVGSIKGWLMESLPLGYLECNGASLVRADYPELFAVLGETYGYADSTHFYIPDLRGMFLRGWDHARALDPDAATRLARGDGTAGDHVGTYQTDELKTHLHTYTGKSVTGGALGGSDPNNLTDASKNTGATGGNETRPYNTNVMYIIKV